MLMEMLLDYNDDNIHDVIDDKYKFYNENIRILDNTINGNHLKVKHYPEVDGYCGTFFHIITKDYMNKEVSCCPNRMIKCKKDFMYNPLMGREYPKEKKRTICPHKISTMYILDGLFLNTSLLIWERSESTPNGRRIRIKLLDVKNRYLVVLEKRKNGDIYYWTSYPVDYDYKIEKFKKEYYKYKETTSHYELDKIEYHKQGTPI